MKVGENIRKIRELRGIKQDDLATMLGITQTAYSKIERNETDLTLPRLSQIADKLGVKEEDILFWDPSTVFNNSTIHSYYNSGTFYNQGLTEKEKALYDRLLESKEQEIVSLKKSIQLLEARQNS